MSDEDDFMSEESYEFEFEDDDQVEQEDLNTSDQVENISHQVETDYYSAKNIKEDEPLSAIAYLKNITNQSETEVGYEWAFKAYKQMMKIYFQLQDFDKVLATLEDLIRILPHISHVYLEESMGRILARYSSSSHEQFVQKLYSILNSIVSSDTTDHSNRLWFKININKLNRYLENEKIECCPQMIDKISKRLHTLSDSAKNTFSLELNAAEIQYYSHLPRTDFKILGKLYKNSISITTTFTHPRIMGIIRECGGKVYFHRGKYEKARLEFYECFKNYDEAGLTLKKKILKYLTLCSILTENEVNPFESPETQIYSSLPEYSDWLDLIKYYSNPNIDAFLEVLGRMRVNNDPMAKDSVFKTATTEILNNLREKILVNLISSFRTVELRYLQEKIGVDRSALEWMLVKLYSEGRIFGIQIDFVDGFIEKNSPQSSVIPSNFDSGDIRFNLKIMNRCNSKNFAEPVTSDSMEIDNDGNQFGENSRVEYKISAEADAEQDLTITWTDVLEHIGSFSYSWERSLKKVDSVISVRPRNRAVLLDYWFSDLCSAIPPVVKNELSQKDQVFLEQKAETVNPKSNALNYTEVDTSSVPSISMGAERTYSHNDRSLALGRTIKDVNSQLDNLISVQYWKRDDEIS